MATKGRREPKFIISEMKANATGVTSSLLNDPVAAATCWKFRFVILTRLNSAPLFDDLIET